MARDLRPCGTYAAYKRHKRHGEPVDEACEAAARAKWDEDRANRRAREAQHRVEAMESERDRAIASPVVDLNELADALENWALVKATMLEAPAGAVAGLSRRREELAQKIIALRGDAGKQKGGGLVDQLAAKRQERRAAAAD